MSKPAELNLSIYQGDSFHVFLRLKMRNQVGDMEYYDLTGSTPKAQIRATKDSTSVLAEFTCTLADQSSMKGGVLATLTDAQTAALNFTTPGVWDLEIKFPDGDRRTVLAGMVTLTKEVTRA